MLRPQRAGAACRPDHGGQGLGRAEVAGKHQVEPAGKPLLQILTGAGHGVEILAVLGDHRHVLLRLAGAGQQLVPQPVAHGDQPVGGAVVPVAHGGGDLLPEPAFDRQHTVQVFRPDVQHVVGYRNPVQLAVDQRREAHEHRAGVVAENPVVTAGQPPQIEQGQKRPADVVEEDAQGGIALAAHLTGPEHPGAVPFLTAGAGVAVAVKPFPFRVVGQAAEHIHLNAVGDHPLHNVVDPEALRPEVLGDHQKPPGHQPLRQTILLTTPT